MWSRALMFLVGAAFIYYQAFAAGQDQCKAVAKSEDRSRSRDYYISEVMVESNVSLEANFTLTSIADFVASVSVRFDTSELQKTLKTLETDLGATVLADTLGMVTIDFPESVVSYQSDPTLKCTFEEASGSAGWNLSRKNERFELNSGTVAILNHSCATNEYKSCVAVTLQKVTGRWAGTYECGFTSGLVRHTAKTELAVALLPDEITMTIKPLAVDCSKKRTGSLKLNVTATILDSTERFNVTWSYNGEEKYQLEPKPGKKFCSEDELDGAIWPKTPDGATVINRTCAAGRVGYKERTCKSGEWIDVFSYCVSQNLTRVLNEADDFKQGLGATQKVAKGIFSDLKNNSESADDSYDSMADLIASIFVLDKMTGASQVIDLQDDVFPDFIGAASNMLNQSWNKANLSTKENMSSNYLKSVEGLIKHIKVNTSNEFKTQNLDLDLKICSKSDCNTSVFNISVSLNRTSGIFKTVAVKNLMGKLRNSKFSNTDPLSLLISATVENNNNDSSLEITLDFPKKPKSYNEVHCVFWNTTQNDWSDEGCWLKTADDNHTLCQCNHLTAFSALMSKSTVIYKYLDVITNVGLGVSICSLLIFLIIEALVWSAVVKTNLSHFRHTALVNIALCLILAHCSLLASSRPGKLSDTWCLIMAVCKHFFFLCMFCWSLCLSIMLMHQLIFVFSPLRKRVFMFFSCILGYVCPTVIVGSSFVYYKYNGNRYYGRDSCWLTNEGLLDGSIYAFFLPVGTVIITNLFSMVVVILTLVKSSAPEGKADDKETIKSILKVVVFLTPVFGITWILGFFFSYLEKPDNHLMTAVIHYSYTILNSFQGLFIFLTGCFGEQKE
ncbi:adhesion G-protein coupled receptor F3 [Diretmus argenteus]